MAYFNVLSHFRPTCTHTPAQAPGDGCSDHRCCAAVLSAAASYRERRAATGAAVGGGRGREVGRGLRGLAEIPPSVYIQTEVRHARSPYLRRHRACQ